MSATLLQRVKTAIVDEGGLLGSYSVRYYRWSDDDLQGTGSVALFRTTGTSGFPNRHVQYTDVSLFLLAARDAVKQADDDMLGVVQYLRTTYSTSGAFILFPLGAYTGPTYLENGRAMFEQVIRCGTEDH